MTPRLRTRPEFEARAIPMPTLLTGNPGQALAAALGLPYLRVIDGCTVILRPAEDA
jgi:hypothetical protein